MYAVIETGGKQYRVEVGTELEVELLDAEPGKSITLDRVLLVADGESAAIGQPLVDGAQVSADVLRLDRGPKLISFKYRPKARSRVKKGHRQELMVLRISDIVFGGKSAAKTAAKAEQDAKTERMRLEEAATAQAAKDAELAAKLAAPAKKATAKAADADETTAEAKKPARRSTAKAKAAATDDGESGDATSDAADKPAAKKSAPKRATKKDE
ncbi:MAG: 50S ribosomal protein L21 [Candidatus Limnocylindrales bacterium]